MGNTAVTVFAGAFAVLGAVGAVTGLVVAVRRVAFAVRAVRCRAVVLATREGPGTVALQVPGQPGVTVPYPVRVSYPLLAFRTADGREVRFEPRRGRAGRGYRPGEEVQVAYDPRDPSRADVGGLRGGRGRRAVPRRHVRVPVPAGPGPAEPGRLTVSDPTRLVPLVFGGVGTVFLVVGLVMLRAQVRFRRRARRCRGVVIDYRERWSSSHGGAGRTLYHPVLEFRTADGRDVRTESRVGTSWRGHRPGDDVTITYDPRDPQHAYPGRGTLALLLALVFVGFGVLFGGIALVILAVTA